MDKCNILVVDDVEIKREILKKIFVADHNVLTAVNGQEALEVLKTTPIDIVLLDIEMPILDGYGVIQTMKEDRALKYIPIVVTTSAVDKSERKALDLGADDFIPQPYDPYIIKKRVENLIHRYVLEIDALKSRSRQRLAIMLEMMDAAYWEWTPSGVYMSERSKEYSISQIKELEEIESLLDGKKYLDYLDPKDASSYEHFYKSVMREGKNDTTIIRVKMIDGSYRWTQIFNMTERDEKGNIIHITRIWRDVDKLWSDQIEKLGKALEDVKIANQAKTIFLAHMSHDLRTPMNAILGLNALTYDEADNPKVVRENLEKMRISGDFMLGLVNDILDMAKLESGEMEMHLERYAYHDFLTSIKAIFVPECVNKGITLKIAEPQTNPVIMVDKARMNQVFFNLLSNAVNYTPEGGTVEYWVENYKLDKGRVSVDFIIKDNGTGISSEFQKQMFAPFTKEDNSYITELKGAGLGLSLTKKLVDQMGGTLSIESAPGKGTKVVVHLEVECVEANAPLGAKKFKNHRFYSDLEGRTVLLVEDHPLNAMLAKKIMEKKGINVLTAVNGQRALDAVAASTPGDIDAIVMDIRMPVMDGYEAARRIRALDREDAKTIPILAMSANAYIEDALKSLDAGMNAHLAKPVVPKRLFQNLAWYMEESEEAKEKRLRDRKLLVVDDLTIEYAVIEETLKEKYTLFYAENGKKALEILAREKGIIGIITDLQMPEMNGEELLRVLRSDPAYDNVAVLVNTQYGDPQMENKLLQEGADDFIYKPMAPPLLQVRLNNILAARKFRNFES